MTIWKYGLKFPGIESGIVTTLRLPHGSKFLAAQSQDDSLVVWVMVDPSAPFVERKVMTVGTGMEAPDYHWGYLATVQMGPMVWHVFYEGDKYPIIEDSDG